MKPLIGGFLKVLCVIVCTGIFTYAQQNQQCDFSIYKPLKIDHFLQMALIEQVKPKYPVAGKAVRAQGKVQIKILVDRNGTVRQACAVEGHPLLQPNALNAAYRTPFKPNFGCLKASPKGKRFITDELVYNFVAP